MNVNGTDAANKLQTSNEKNLKGWIVKMADQIKTALPSNITPERMVRIALTAISKTPKLADCTPESFLGALLTSAQLGLECNTPLGQSYLIPYYNGKKKCMETQFQLGYQGLIDLCYRTGQYKTIQARVVYEGDLFEYEYGLEETLTHKPMGKTKNPIAVYAYYQLVNGAKAFEVMTWKEVEEHSQKYSQAVKSGYESPWKTDPESMAKKTVLKKVLKYAPKTVEIAEGITGDSAIINTQTVSDGNTTDVIKNFDYSPENVEDAEVTKKEQPVQKEPEKKDEPKQAAENNVSPEEEAEIERQFERQQQFAFTPDVF